MIAVVNKVKTYFENKDLKTLVMWILIGLLVVLFAFPLIKRLFEKVRNTALSVGSTIGTEEAKTIVTSLNNCFNNVFNNYNCIRNNLRYLSPADYYKVKEAFGYMSRSSITGEVTWDFMPFSNSLNLTEWLASELSVEELQNLRSVNPNLPI